MPGNSSSSKLESLCDKLSRLRAASRALAGPKHDNYSANIQLDFSLRFASRDPAIDSAPGNFFPINHPRNERSSGEMQYRRAGFVRLWKFNQLCAVHSLFPGRRARI
jgi:hypothetical protein